MWETVALGGCNRGESHNKVVDGIDYTGKAFMYPIFYSCDRPSCEICGKRSWRGRAARHIEEVLTPISKLLGLPIEHIIVSVHWSEWDVPVSRLMVSAVKALRACGVLGESKMLHADRRGRMGIHFHCLGFIKDGYKCRDCEKHPFASEKVCAGCSGLEALAREVEKVSGYTVKVAVDKEGLTRKRDSVRATANYQLSHASVLKGVDRFRVVTYAGICSNKSKSKVGAKPLVKESLKCPVCKHKQLFYDYVGFKRRFLVPSWESRGRWLTDRSVDSFERGKSAWVVHVAGGFGACGKVG